MSGVERTILSKTEVAEHAARVAKRCLAVSVGYLVAVLVASIVTVAHLALPLALPGESEVESLGSVVASASELVIGGSAIAFPSALPGFLVVLLLAAGRGWGAGPFMAAGALNVVPALWLTGNPFGSGAPDDLFFGFCCVGGGLAGGFAYWFTAERPRLTRPAPSES